MVLTSGNSDAVSFTDGTSLPNPTTISIHAKVIREFPLDWYYRLLGLVLEHAGELKSTRVVDPFFALPEYDRRNIFQTLKHVRIHVSDPRPYSIDIDKALSETVHQADVEAYIYSLPPPTRTFAKKERARIIATDMLFDAPARQIIVRHRISSYLAGTRIMNERLTVGVSSGTSTHDPLPICDLSPFRAKHKQMYNVVSSFLSQSLTVFDDSLSAMDHPADPFFLSATLANLLSRPHAFDKGNPEEVAWIDKQRRDVVAATDYNGMYRPDFQPLPELESKESYFIQAADFAAGIARELWHRNSLVHLVRSFNYVTYNGKRITEDQAASHQRMIDTRKP